MIEIVIDLEHWKEWIEDNIFIAPIFLLLQIPAFKSEWINFADINYL